MKEEAMTIISGEEARIILDALVFSATRSATKMDGAYMRSDFGAHTSYKKYFEDVMDLWARLKAVFKSADNDDADGHAPEGEEADDDDAPEGVIPGTEV